MALASVGPALDEFEIVVAERPEERFRAFECAGVVVSLERERGLGHQLAHPLDEGTVDRHAYLLGGNLAVGKSERKSRSVEELHGELAADLHLPRIERGVDSRPRARCPVANRVRAVIIEQIGRDDDVPDAL